MFEKENVLSSTQIGHLTHIAKRFMEMAEMVSSEPFDPKIALHLKMAADLADEQVSIGKFYSWPKQERAYEPNKEPSVGYKLLQQDDAIEQHAEDEPETKPEPEPTTPNEASGGISDNDIHGWLDGLDGLEN